MHFHPCCNTFPQQSVEFSSAAFSNDGLHTVEQLSGIDAEIMRTEESIVMLVKSHAFLKRRRNLFSPAVNLPSELLSLIFEFACTANDPDGDEYVNNLYGGMNLGLAIGGGAVTPLFLGTICSAWRTIAKGTSQLWNKVIVYINNIHANKQSKLLQSWLRNAENRPLSIRVVEDDSVDFENDDDANWGIAVTSSAIIDVLVAHSRKWHSIDIFLPWSWKAPLARVKYDLPLLTVAKLRVTGGSPAMSRFDAFSCAPKLQEVTLVGYSVTEVLLPWTQLQRLDVEYFNVGECLETLNLCPLLRSCQFQQLCGGRQPFAPYPIRHERLESFELVVHFSEELQALFRTMTLPNLKELVLSVSKEEPLLEAILPLIRRSTSGLRHLHLVGLTPPEPDLIECLKELPLLASFLLLNPMTETGGKLTRKFLKMMRPRRNKSNVSDNNEDVDGKQNVCLIPKLEKLEYQGAVGFTPHELLKLLASRWRVGQLNQPSPHQECAMDNHIDDSNDPFPRQSEPFVSRLSSVVITTTRKMRFEGSDANLLHSLVKEGMVLQFLSDPNADFF